MATNVSALGQSGLVNANKSTSDWYKTKSNAMEMRNMRSAQALQMFSSLPSMGSSSSMASVGSLANRNDQMLQSILEKNASKYDQNMQMVLDYNAKSKPFFEGFSNVMGDLKESSAALKNFSASSVLNPTGYSSSDNKVVAVNSGSPFTVKEIKVNVKQQATGQTTKTDAVNSKNSGDLNGPATINIKTGEGKSADLKFNFLPSTTNKEAMDTIAKSVNSAKIGVSAVVVEKDGKSSLEFKSTNTGEKATLDIKMSGNLQKELAPAVTQEAKNAVYTVNGGAEITSKTNNVQLESGNDSVNVTLKGVGEATLGKNTVDTKKVVNAVKNFVNDINNAVSFLKKNSSNAGAVKSLTNSLTSFKYRESALNGMGIEVKNGKLSVNEEKFTKALTDNPDKVKDFLGGSSGYAAEINKTATAALRKQTQYMPPPQMNSNGGLFNAGDNSSANQSFFNNANPYSGTVIDLLA